MLGRIRSIIQTISYEIVIILLIILELLIIERFILIKLSIIQNNCWFIFINFIIFIILYIRILAELNRTPFDLTEGESELVSGFNVEYIRGKFALIFIVEYGIILFFIYLFKLIFIGGILLNFIDILVYLILTYIVILIRARFPRIRYDKLIYLI